MRHKFNLDIPDMRRMTFLIHGNYGVGKTRLLGDMLLHERTGGGKVAFLNIAGEDGHLSVANLGLGEVGETVDTLKDFQDALVDYKKAGMAALAIDGGAQFGKLVIKSVCGDRLPSVGKGSDDWQKIHQTFEAVIASLRDVAPIVMMASRSDRSTDQISGEVSLTPDMPGRQAAGVGAQFDFVFVMKAIATGPNKIRRFLQTAPMANTVIRARLPMALPHEIDIPEGGGGWAALRKHIAENLDTALVKGAKK